MSAARVCLQTRSGTQLRQLRRHGTVRAISRQMSEATTRPQTRTNADTNAKAATTLKTAERPACPTQKRVLPARDSSQMPSGGTELRLSRRHGTDHHGHRLRQEVTARQPGLADTNAKTVFTLKTME